MVNIDCNRSSPPSVVSQKKELPSMKKELPTPKGVSSIGCCLAIKKILFPFLSSLVSRIRYLYYKTCTSQLQPYEAILPLYSKGKIIKEELSQHEIELFLSFSVFIQDTALQETLFHKIVDRPFPSFMELIDGINHNPQLQTLFRTHFLEKDFEFDTLSNDSAIYYKWYKASCIEEKADAFLIDSLRNRDISEFFKEFSKNKQLEHFFFDSFMELPTEKQIDFLTTTCLSPEIYKPFIEKYIDLYFTKFISGNIDKKLCERIVALYELCKSQGVESIVTERSLQRFTPIEIAQIGEQSREIKNQILSAIPPAKKRDIDELIILLQSDTVTKEQIVGKSVDCKKWHTIFSQNSFQLKSVFTLFLESIQSTPKEVWVEKVREFYGQVSASDQLLFLHTLSLHKQLDLFIQLFPNEEIKISIGENLFKIPLSMLQKSKLLLDPNLIANKKEFIEIKPLAALEQYPLDTIRDSFTTLLHPTKGDLDSIVLSFHLLNLLQIEDTALQKEIEQEMGDLLDIELEKQEIDYKKDGAYTLVRAYNEWENRLQQLHFNSVDPNSSLSKAFGELKGIAEGKVTEILQNRLAREFKCAKKTIVDSLMSLPSADFQKLLQEYKGKETDLPSFFLFFLEGINELSEEEQNEKIGQLYSQIEEFGLPICIQTLFSKNKLHSFTKQFPDKVVPISIGKNSFSVPLSLIEQNNLFFFSSAKSSITAKSIEIKDAQAVENCSFASLSNGLRIISKERGAFNTADIASYIASLHLSTLLGIKENQLLQKIYREIGKDFIKKNHLTQSKLEDPNLDLENLLDFYEQLESKIEKLYLGELQKSNELSQTERDTFSLFKTIPESDLKLIIKGYFKTDSDLKIGGTYKESSTIRKILNHDLIPAFTKEKMCHFLYQSKYESITTESFAKKFFYQIQDSLFTIDLDRAFFSFLFSKWVPCHNLKSVIARNNDTLEKITAIPDRIRERVAHLQCTTLVQLTMWSSSLSNLETIQVLNPSNQEKLSISLDLLSQAIEKSTSTKVTTIEFHNCMFSASEAEQPVLSVERVILTDSSLSENEIAGIKKTFPNLKECIIDGVDYFVS